MKKNNSITDVLPFLEVVGNENAIMFNNLRKNLLNETFGFDAKSCQTQHIVR